MMQPKPKVFLLGASGFIGYQLALRLRDEFLISGATFYHPVTVPDAQIYLINMKNPELLDTLVRIQNPDFLINCMGITDRKIIEAHPQVADNINMIMPVNFSIMASKLKAKFIQLSCSEVYDGSGAPYAEDNYDFTMSDAYGKQKITAESYIRAQTLESDILRLGKVVGLGNPYRPNEFDRIRYALAKKEELVCSKVSTFSYLSAASVAEALRLIMKGSFPGRHRIYNLGGPNFTQFEFAQEWAKLLNLETKNIVADDLAEERNLSLDCKNFKEAFPEWKQETKESLFKTLLEELCPGAGIKKWRKTLQIQ